MSFVAAAAVLSGYHRKSVLRLLRQQPADYGVPPPAGADRDPATAFGRSRRVGSEVVQLLEVLWEASDHLCGKRLAAMLPTLERHGHLEIESALRQKLIQVSPATIDRLPAPAPSARAEQHRRRTDNDTAFMNEELERWCAELRQPVELTRSRAYISNDQAWVEQKNGMLGRRVVGHRRLEGPQQLEQLCQFYAALRLFTNINQPSAKWTPLWKATLVTAGDPAGATTNRSPRRIGCWVGAGWDAKPASGLRRCSITAIQWHCWR